VVDIGSCGVLLMAILMLRALRVHAPELGFLMPRRASLNQAHVGFSGSPSVSLTCALAYMLLWMLRLLLLAKHALHALRRLHHVFALVLQKPRQLLRLPAPSEPGKRSGSTAEAMELVSRRLTGCRAITMPFGISCMYSPSYCRAHRRCREC
jgi:hypothetical protein